MTLRVRPVTPNCGAEIDGVDLADPTITGSADVAEALRAALAQHLVLFARGQRLDRAAQKRLTRVFGPVQRVPYVTPSPDDPDVVRVLKEADEQRIAVFGGDWHSDFSFLERPPAGSVLVAEQVPPVGGDTLWANQIAAWETLPDDLRAAVAGREAIHTGAPYGVRNAPAATAGAGLSRSIRMARGDPEADREMPHPVGRLHPPSGRTALFVNKIYTTRLEGMTAAESAPILARLYEHATRPELSCRLRWTADTVAVWDNRATLHYAVNDYDGHRRLLYRTTFAGERPVVGGT